MCRLSFLRSPDDHRSSGPKNLHFASPEARATNPASGRDVRSPRACAWPCGERETMVRNRHHSWHFLVEGRATTLTIRVNQLSHRSASKMPNQGRRFDMRETGTRQLSPKADNAASGYGFRGQYEKTNALRLMSGFRRTWR